MANWLQKTSQTYLAKLKAVHLPAVRPLQLPAVSRGGANRSSEQLPAASVIYGVAASALLVISLYFLFTGRWATGLLMLLPAAALLGFALHFLRR